MKTEVKTLYLHNKAYNVEVDTFNDEDLHEICKIYNKWADLSKELQQLKCRRLNFPEISEIFYCLVYDSWRVNAKNISGEHSSFDCYNPKTKSRIQVKSASSKGELTSFGPDSEWDELYFLDFYNDGIYDGTFEIYNIPSEYVYDWEVSKKKHITFIDRQLEGKRPRFSLRKLIREYGLSPEKVVNLCELVNSE